MCLPSEHVSVELSHKYGCVGVLLEEQALGETSLRVMILRVVNPSVTVSYFGT